MASGEEELPAALGWMVGLLEPGTRPGVFTFFKAVVIALVGCVAFMLFGLDMPSDVQFHLKIFLALSVALMILTIWFFGELQIAMAAAPAAAEEKKEK
ncbi:hypothetical protein KFE25_011363 [Diacronema lutheri]|uniref:Uncharacterized protein n=2 Tax=Diacronema lutheri TaxID=2081491 RepID=A0A8J5XBL6_DIALT|nr:hypothetical protein KFE25_011363 [Diacronema lutheri]